ncbi:hypothetical protein [Thalassotalea euphylliae]|uniref:hypothetical protein n=1 Tax=Thalassotalea euphylliae TaxID=1655234 RepID=UPI0015F26E53|nr:hypothetical protein [Thalassotalea euphylliae]
MSSKLRLIWSALVAFVFYFAWAYWANNIEGIDRETVLRAAFVQASFSASVTLVFTFVLEKAVAKFGGSCFSLVFIVPVLCSVHSKTRHNLAILNTFNEALDAAATHLKGKCVTGSLLAPLVPLSVQASLVIMVNVINQTPNLWLTVAPSIFFSALYGYSYTFTLLKQRN